LPKGNGDYSFHTMLVSLHVFDTPVGYAPRGDRPSSSRSTTTSASLPAAGLHLREPGPQVDVDLDLLRRDDPTAPDSREPLRAGRGQLGFANYAAATRTYAYDLTTRSQLVRVSDDPIVYERRMADGSVDVYSQPNGRAQLSAQGLPHPFDRPQGNAVQLTYDASLRLVAIPTPSGRSRRSRTRRPTTRSRSPASRPFGAVGTFEYDPPGASRASPT